VKRHHLSALVVIAVALVGSACVSTRVIKGGPDPRAGHATASSSTAPVSSLDLGPNPSGALRVVEDRSATDPIVNLRIAFLAGSSSDPPGKEGLTALTARLMAEATNDLDAAALADALFPMAAELSVQVDKDATVFVGRVHKDHETAFLKILGDVLTRPRLDPADFARLRDEQRAFLTSTLRTGNDEALQREALELMIFDGDRVTGRPAPEVRHPYGWTVGGTVAGLSAITLEDVKAWRDAVFTVDRAVVGIGGGASDALVGQLKAVVSTLPIHGDAIAEAPPPSPPSSSRVLIVEKPSAGTAISVGFAVPTLSRAHPDWPAMKLAETYFGEHRNLIGHLFHSMREVRGLNYGDYAYVEHFVEQPGGTFERLNIPRRTQYFSMWIRPVQHQTRLFALRMTGWELARFVERGIPDDAAFERVRGFVAGYWRSKRQEPMRRLGYAMDRAIAGQGTDPDALLQRIADLRREDVNAAIRRHLRADRLSWVVVTEDAASLVEALRSQTPATMTYTGAVAPEVQAEDEGIATFDPGFGADDILVVPPGALFER
jgi:zinc protease